ncbi:MAG: phospholipid carrier-dependent glycosyltransferase [Pyrinomonadaceae bacterium]
MMLRLGRVRGFLMLVIVATIPRLLGALFLPNTFGDAYVYIRDIATLSTKIKAGTFALTDLYGFWLPLYQFVSALVNVFVGNGFYTGKIVSALAGVGVCLLVYAITLRVVQHQTAALLSFLLIALNPLHIMNSASAMTDVPHALFVLASLYFVLKKRWVLAAVFAALAGLTRVESWMLIALIPTIQFWKERRVSIPAILIMACAPLFWFYVSWKATGDWLACFKVRAQYKDWLLTQNPTLAEFSVRGVIQDIAMLVSGIDLAVLCAALVAGWLILRRLARRGVAEGVGANDASNAQVGSPNIDAILPVLVFFFPFLALLIVAYLTHQQPIIFPRYGLILFSVGIPILAWTYFAIVRRRPQWSRRILTAIVLICAVNFSAQFAGGVGELNRYAAQRRVADYLRDHFDRTSGTKIFCDEGTVRALSGIAEDRFVSSADVPKTYEGFWSALATKNVEWLVIARQPGSTPAKLFPRFEYGEQIGPYHTAMYAKSKFLPVEIHVYRRIQ